MIIEDEETQIDEVAATSIARLEEIRNNFYNPPKEDPKSLSEELKVISQIMGQGDYEHHSKPSEEINTAKPLIADGYITASNGPCIINGKYDEDAILDNIARHIRSTYGEHYVNDSGGQVFDDAISSGDLIPWARVNIKKYISRYGKKNGHNREDLLKAAHFVIIMLYVDQLNKKAYNEVR